MDTNSNKVNTSNKLNTNLNILRYIDYSLYTDRERAEKTSELLAECPAAELYSNGSIPTDGNALSKQLEGLANYILYGKDESKLTNSIQQKRIMQPNTKFGSYARRNEDSLDELMDNPLFDENTIHEYNEKNIYTKPKISIKRPKYDKDGNMIDAGDSVIPG